MADVIGSSQPDPNRRSRRRTAQRKRKRRARSFVVLLVVLAVVAGAGGLAWLRLGPDLVEAYHHFTEPADYPGPGDGAVQVKIPDGATGRQIGGLLVDSGVVKSVKGFVKAFGENPASANIRPGTYELKQRMTSAEAITALLNDANRLLDRVTLPEGIRVADVPALVARRTKIPLADLQTALKNPASFGLPPEAKGDVEGWLFPATYDVDPDTTARTLLQHMVERTVSELNNLGVPQPQWREKIILASLVQAEGKHAEDFGKIARVLQNRLDQHIKLQLDTTVHYATKQFKVATTVAGTKVNSRYNTYLYEGLPIGAIDNPGRAALQAAISPTPGKWLYFVAVNPDTGETKFAETAQQFAQIKAEYDAWAKAHPGR